jgi:hypothetical protein
MRWFPAFCLALFLQGPAVAQEHHAVVPFPEQFAIGRDTFFDFGPPFHYYEILVVRPAADGSSVARILLTPPGAACLVPAKVETASASLRESVPALLGNTNPCTIPEKELRRELKRCKHCLVFSGATVTMHVPCGANSRLIRSDLLDKDMFSSAPNTPKHTSSTMQLLAHLDNAFGPGVMEKPMFSLPDNEQSAPVILDSTIQRELESGTYDELFPGAAEKPSTLLRASQVRYPSPTVQLLSSSPSAPKEFALPKYPPIARAARVQGTVSFTAALDPNGVPITPIFAPGNLILIEAVKREAANWKFPLDAAGEPVSVSIEFSLNCPDVTK